MDRKKLRAPFPYFRYKVEISLSLTLILFLLRGMRRDATAQGQCRAFVCFHLITIYANLGYRVLYNHAQQTRVQLVGPSETNNIHIDLFYATLHESIIHITLTRHITHGKSCNAMNQYNFFNQTTTRSLPMSACVKVVDCYA